MVCPNCQANNPDTNLFCAQCGAALAPSPAFQPPAYAYVKPHRGAVILTLGILGFFCSGIAGLIALILGTHDLREMKAGVMDPSGQGLTQAGAILGILCTALAMCGLLYRISGVGGILESR